jgi:hypothetical protein
LYGLQIAKSLGPDDSSLTPAHEQARAALRLPTVRPGDHQPPNRALRDDEDDLDRETDDVAAADLGKTKQVPRAPADSPGDDVSGGGPIPATLQGHRSVQNHGGARVEHVNCQQLQPTRLAELRTAGPDASGSSLHSEGGSAVVQSLNQAAASANISLPGSPSASPKRPDFSPASSGHGQRFGKTPSRPPQSVPDV